MGKRSTDLSSERAQRVQDLNLDDNGSTAPFELFGLCNVGARGTFGGGTIKLQKCFDGLVGEDTSWWDMSIATDGTPAGWTTNMLLQIQEPERGVYYRWVLTGASAPDIDTHLSSQERLY